MQGKVYTGKAWIDPPRTQAELEDRVQQARAKSRKTALYWIGAVVIWLVLAVLAMVLGGEGGINTFAVLTVVGVGVYVYVVLCRMVADAAVRKGRSRTAWFWIAFLFGVLIPAVIVAAMSNQSPVVVAVGTPQVSAAGDTETCPMCAEEIKAAALKCKHCGSDVSTA